MNTTLADVIETTGRDTGSKDGAAATFQLAALPPPVPGKIYFDPETNAAYVCPKWLSDERDYTPLCPLCIVDYNGKVVQRQLPAYPNHRATQVLSYLALLRLEAEYNGTLAGFNLPAEADNPEAARARALATILKQLLRPSTSQPRKMLVQVKKDLLFHITQEKIRLTKSHGWQAHAQTLILTDLEKLYKEGLPSITMPRVRQINVTFTPEIIGEGEQVVGVDRDYKKNTAEIFVCARVDTCPLAQQQACVCRYCPDSHLTQFNYVPDELGKIITQLPVPKWQRPAAGITDIGSALVVHEDSIDCFKLPERAYHYTNVISYGWKGSKTRYYVLPRSKAHLFRGHWIQRYLSVDRYVGIQFGLGAGAQGLILDRKTGDYVSATGGLAGSISPRKADFYAHLMVYHGRPLTAVEVEKYETLIGKFPVVPLLAALKAGQDLDTCTVTIEFETSNRHIWQDVADTFEIRTVEDKPGWYNYNCKGKTTRLVLDSKTMTAIRLLNKQRESMSLTFLGKKIPVDMWLEPFIEGN